MTARSVGTVVPSGLNEPFSLEDAAIRTPLLDAGRGAAVLRIPGVAEYRVGSDGSVDARAVRGATPAEVACFANGPVEALKMLLSGSFPLRAAAVATTRGAVVICGPGGVGKSATAAAMALRGGSVISDQVVAIECGPEPRASGKDGPIALWPIIARELGLDVAEGAPVRPGLAKRAFHLGAVPVPPSPEVRLITILEIDGRLGHPVLTKVGDGRQRLHSLLSLQWHKRLIGPLGLQVPHFDWVSSVATRLPMVRVSRPRSPMTLSAVVDLIESALRDYAGEKPEGPSP